MSETGDNQPINRRKFFRRMTAPIKESKLTDLTKEGDTKLVKNPGRGISRRKALEIGGTAVIGTAIGLHLGNNIGNADQNPVEITVSGEPVVIDRIVSTESRLEQAGLSEYLPLAKSVSHYKEKYGDLVGSWYSGAKFPFMKELTEVLEGVSDGSMQPSDEKVRFWSEGWGVNKNDAVGDAIKHASDITIEGNVPIDYVDQVEHTLDFLAESLPGIALSYPDTIKPVESGGYYAGTHIGLVHEVSSEDLGNSFHVAIHEGKHALDQTTIPVVKKYVEKEAMAEHAAILFESTMETLDEWVDTPMERIIETNGYIFGMGESTEEDARNAIVRLTEKLQPYISLFDKTGLTKPIILHADATEMERAFWQYQALTHAVMINWKDLVRTDSKHDFLADPNIQEIVRGVIGEVAHGYVYSIHDSLGDSSHSHRQREVIKSTVKAFGALREPTIEALLIAGHNHEFARRGRIYEGFGMKLVSFDDQVDDYHIPHRVYSIPNSTYYYVELFNGMEITKQYIFNIPRNDLEGETVVIDSITVDETPKFDLSGNKMEVRTPLVIYKRTGDRDNKVLLLTSLNKDGEVVQTAEAENEGKEMKVPELVDPYPPDVIPYNLTIRNINGEEVDSVPFGALIVHDKVYSVPRETKTKDSKVLLISSSSDSVEVDLDSIVVNTRNGAVFRSIPVLVDEDGTTLGALFNSERRPPSENADNPGQIIFNQEKANWGVRLSSEMLEIYNVVRNNPHLVSMKPRLYRKVRPGTEDFEVGQELVLYETAVDGSIIENSRTIPVEEIFLIR